MKKIFTIIISALVGLSRPSFAQYTSVQNSPLAKYITTDTIYYLADTARVPKNDRILTIADAYVSKNFTIYCACLNTKETYIVLVSLDKRKAIIIDEKKFKLFKLTSLANLIAIVKANNTEDYGKKHVIYIIEPLKNHRYTLHRVVNKSNNIVQGGE